jgi:hypothetical protein
MSKNLSNPFKIGVKYCGGCQPDYDRTELVAAIADRLGPDIKFVSANSSEASMILAVQGCKTACADLTSFEHLEVWTITSPEQADDFIKYANALRGGNNQQV